MRQLACQTLAALILVAAHGCSSTGQNKIRDAETISRIEVGVTTQDEVRELLGEPSIVTRTKEGRERWTYFRSRDSINPVGLVPFAGAIVTVADRSTHTLRIDFVESDIVGAVEQKEAKSQSGR